MRTRTKTRTRSALAAAVALTALLSLPATAAAGGEVWVDSSSTTAPATCGAQAEPCATLDDAVARSTGGELIYVAAGTYAGTTVTAPVHFHASGTATITSTITVLATVTLDGFAFAPSTGPAVEFGYRVDDSRIGASVIRNSSFADVDAVAAIVATNPLAGLHVIDNTFAAGTGAASTAIQVDGWYARTIPNVLIEGNEFDGYAGAAIDATATPELVISGNDATNVGSLARLSRITQDMTSATIEHNTGTGFSNAAVIVDSGVRRLSVSSNELREGADAFLRVEGSGGPHESGGIELRSNDVHGFASAIDAHGSDHVGVIVARGNRFANAARSGNALVNSSAGSIDARLNWWGTSAGTSASTLSGDRVDASSPLRLVGVVAPAAIFTGGTAAARVRLVGPTGGAPEVDASGFAVTFSSSSATVEQPAVTFDHGEATALVHAGAVPGATTTVATLDSEQVSATTEIVALGTPIDDSLATPSVAESMRPGLTTPAHPTPFRAIVRYSPSLNRVALSRGLRLRLYTNRAASARMTFSISAADARRIGLRSRSSKARTRYVIARTNAPNRRGTRIVTARVNARARRAIARVNRRIVILSTTSVRTRSGHRRTIKRQFALPATVR